jgi:hypothetical protein
MTPVETALVDISKLLTVSSIGAALAYWFGIRGKNTDISIQRNKELNIILSNMLTVWHYFAKLNQLTDLPKEQKARMVFPLALLPVVVANSNAFDEAAFDELEKSLQNLKQYDPLAFHHLEGIGRRFRILKDDFVAPTLKSQQLERSGHILGMFRKSILSKTTQEFEKHLVHVAKLISKRVEKEVNAELAKNSPQAVEELIEEYNQEFYEMITSIMPEDMAKPDYASFKEELSKPEWHAMMEQQVPLIAKHGFGAFISIVAQNPSITPDELAKEIVTHQV